VRRIVVLASVVILVAACGEDAGTSGSSSSSSGSSSGSSGSSSGSLYSTEQKTGIATYYDADGSGNCSFDKSPNDMDVVALNFPEYADSAACGSCIHVKGPSGEVTVRVTDSCPGCEKGHLDLSEQAFAKIAALEKGRVDITYQTVACKVSGNLAYHFKDGSSKYWTAIQVRNHRLPVTKLEYQRDGAWAEMKREDYNYFVESKGVGDQPGGLKLKITAADGQVIEDTLPGAVPDDQTVDGSKQFN
jgi:expansin (peptidoglycan-binding protein)